MKARILILAAALTLAALPVQAQNQFEDRFITNLQKSIVEAWEASAEALEAGVLMWESQAVDLEASGLEANAKAAELFREKASAAQPEVLRAAAEAAEADYSEAATDFFNSWDYPRITRESVSNWRAEALMAREAGLEGWAQGFDIVATLWEAAAEAWEAAIQPGVGAFSAEAAAYEAAAAYDFVKYDGRNYSNESKASDAAASAGWGRGDAYWERQLAQEAHLHVMKARENASNWRRTAEQETGNLKELANKTADVWGAAVYAWERVGE